MKIKKQIHSGWFNKQKEKEVGVVCPFGEYQYIYFSGTNKISLVEFKNYYRDGKDIWEIFCQYGNLFEDVEKFDTKEEAEKQIKKYLK